MESFNFFDQLLEIGRHERYDEIHRVPGAGVQEAVIHFAGSGLHQVLKFCKDLPRDDRRAFIMAVAKYEDSVGGIGSVTTLHRLLPLAEDPKAELLDWILQNTNSYWYYANGARSLEQLQAFRKDIATRKNATMQRESERYEEARVRRATAATESLYNAVRRGDVKAVRALLAKGADPSATAAPDGRSLLSLAQDNNHGDIVAELQNSSPATSAHQTV